MSDVRFDAEGFFLSAVDQARYQRMMDSLVLQRRSVALLSSSGALVERREIPHWFLKITDYAQELHDALDDMPGWPEEVRKMQHDWIGRSEGAEIEFAMADGGEPLTVYPVDR